MNHASLFSGIGGFDLAAEWIGWTNVFQVEIDEFCQKVLTKHFPDTKRYKDIYEFKGEKYKGQVDVISGGFPCQPFSAAGKRKGTADDRYLWPEMLRVISEVKPAFVVGENVAGLLSMENGRTLERILFDLEDEGYRVEVFVIPACSVGAWHRRDRVWIVANSRCRGQQGQGQYVGRMQPKAFEDREAVRFLNTVQKKSRPYYNRDNYGISKKLDKCRMTALGNAIVPQVAYEIFKAIDDINRETR